jgi:hypothetical protein
LCESPADCFAGNACTSALFSGASPPAICIGICTADAECHADERCQIGGFQNEAFGTCQRFCDPTGADPGAITCEANERCVAVTGQPYGFCEATDSLCTSDGACLAGQACDVLGNDFLGECVDGCTTSADCATGEQCHIQPGGETCTMATAADDCNSGVCVGTTCAPSTVGICRTPGGACSPSPRTAAPASEIILPLRGNAQCLPMQTCSATMADVLGTCMGTVVTPGDSDAGVDGGPTP